MWKLLGEIIFKNRIFFSIFFLYIYILTSFFYPNVLLAALLMVNQSVWGSYFYLFQYSLQKFKKLLLFFFLLASRDLVCMCLLEKTLYNITAGP